MFNSSYTGIRRDLLDFLTGSSLNILDVGCATGANGKFLLESGIAHKMYGIEVDHEMATVAKKYYNEVFIGNLNDISFLEKVSNYGMGYDYIIFGDVLEHLQNPVEVLNLLSYQLKRNGKIIISLPNVAHIETFIQIYIHGTFPLNERGIFDKTHLRWFTKRDAFRLVKSSKLEVINYIPKFRARDAIGSEFNWKYKLIKIINKEWVTFQHLLICGHAK